MRVLLVAPNASAQMGGEAILPLHWLRELRALDIDAHLLTHARCREELSGSDYAAMPITYVEDSRAERRVWEVCRNATGFQRRAAKFALTFLSTVRLGAQVRQVARREGFDLIHQVTPVSPRLASPVTHPSIPVVMGPMNGNMTYPPGFKDQFDDDSGKMEEFARSFSALSHYVFQGKPRADRIFVANQRTKAGLPPQVAGAHVVEFVENGVNLDLFSGRVALPPQPIRFIFVGRLVPWKAVDILLEAFAEMESESTLTICGDGESRPMLEDLGSQLGVQDRVDFVGAVPQARVRELIENSHALILPSLYECGGAVVLEAMAMRRAVIATDWGGPRDYVTPQTGLLVEPVSRDGFKDRLVDAMRTLKENPEMVLRMGEAGRRRVEERFAWKRKGEAMLALYDEVLTTEAYSAAI